MDESQKKLPLPQKDLPLPEKELPAPQDMLLPKPTFWEKHAPSLHPVLMVLIFSFLVADIFYFAFIGFRGKQTETPQPQATPTALPTPTSYPIIDCPEHINQKHKFSVECPEGWQAIEYGEDYDGGRTIVKFIPPNIQAISESKYITPEFFIEITSSPFSESPRRNKDIEGDPDVVKDWKKITVDGVTGHYYNSMNCAPLCPTTFDIPFDGGKKTLSIKKVEVPDEIKRIYQDTGILIEDATDNLYLQMISSFKFIDQGQLVDTKDQTFCTQEAKVCPDGTSVGRTGPNCEFATCP